MEGKLCKNGMNNRNCFVTILREFDILFCKQKLKIIFARKSVENLDPETLEGAVIDFSPKALVAQRNGSAAWTSMEWLCCKQPPTPCVIEMLLYDCQCVSNDKENRACLTRVASCLIKNHFLFFPSSKLKKLNCMKKDFDLFRAIQSKR